MVSTRLLELQEEQDRRDREGVRIYRPYGDQCKVHSSTANELVVRGGKRCISGDTLIYDPVANVHRRVDEITEPFYVESRDPSTGRLVIAKAGVPFTKGVDDFYEVHLSNGRSFKATGGHLVLSASGWTNVSSVCDSIQGASPCPLVSSSGISLQAFPRDACHLKKTGAGCLGDCSPCRHQCGERLRAFLGFFQSSFPSQLGALERIPVYSSEDGLAGRRVCNRSCPQSDRPSTLCALGQTSGHAASFGIHSACILCLQPLSFVEVLHLFLQQSSDQLHTIAASVRSAIRTYLCSAHAVQQTSCDTECSIHAIQLLRKFLENFSPPYTTRLPFQHRTCSFQPCLCPLRECVFPTRITQVGKGIVWDFEVESTGNYCLAGIVHHNSGKSVSVSVEVASRITGIPVHDENGVEFKRNWSTASPDYPRTYWFIGYDLNHIGQTIHRLMFQAGMGGQFRCIKDEQTGKWRTWNRADPNDVKLRSKSRLTEPLIPPRLIVEDSWQWEDKRGYHFKSLTLYNGARIFAFPSTGIQPKMGDSVSGIWIDEDIAYPEHLKEWQDRLTDENGWLIWSVWPHQKNPALLGLIERAELASLQPEPLIESVQLIMTQNPFIPAEGKRASLERMGSEEEIARRDRGDVNMDSFAMYSFDQKVHTIRRRSEHTIFEPERSEVYELIRNIYERQALVPQDWTRYLVIDPSHTRTGILSWCVPPHILEDLYVGNLMLCEWELVCKRMTAEAIAKAIADKAGTNKYEAFIIDNRAGRQTHAGRDTNTRAFFSNAFRDAGLASRLTNADFIPGCDVPATRYRAVRNLMEVVPGVGIPQLMLIDERCPQTKREFQKYMKKRVAHGSDSDSVLDEPSNPRLYDLMACTEYAAAHMERLFIQGTAYVEPSVYSGRGSVIYKKAMAMRRNMESDEGVVTLGVG